MPHQLSVCEQIKQLQEKAISCRELTQHYLARIDKYDPKLNCFITLDPAQAIQAAEAADRAIAKGDRRSLLGIPVAHKDNFCTQAMRTTCGSKMLSNFEPNYDATLVEKLNQAGCITVGKTNLDEFAMGSSSENSYFEATKNPWDLEKVSGGSSGGSAAAVAAGLIPLSTGTDTGGSIRQPAAFCGISGIKPTYGRVSRYGLIAFASSLDQGGIFARHVTDLALGLQAIAGHDPKDATAAKIAVPNYPEALAKPLTELKIGLPQEFFDDSLDTGMAECIQQAIKTLENIGFQFKTITLPHAKESMAVYYVIAPAECSSNLARYDGIRYGYRAADPIDLEDLYCKTRSEGFGLEVKRRIMVGTYTLSSGYYEAYYHHAQKVRQLISDDYQQAFESVDLILTPTTPTTAFKLGEKTQDPVSMYYADLYTTAANLAGLPALALPCGKLNELPVSLQLIGNYFQEAHLFNVGHQYQQVTNWHLQIPPEEQWES